MVWRCCAHAFEHMVFCSRRFFVYIEMNFAPFIRSTISHARNCPWRDLFTIYVLVWFHKRCQMHLDNEEEWKQRKDNARCHRQGENHSIREWKRTKKKTPTEFVGRSAAAAITSFDDHWKSSIETLIVLFFFLLIFFLFHFNYGIVIYSFSQSIQRVLDARCPAWPAGQPTCVSVSEWVSAHAQCALLN